MLGIAHSLILESLRDMTLLGGSLLMKLLLRILFDPLW